MHKLGTVCKKIGSGATPTGGKETYLDRGEYTLIRSQNVLDFTFSYDGLAYINKSQAGKLNNVAIENDDVLLNITGDSVARVCQVPNHLLPARVNQHVAIIRPKSDILSNTFLKYYLLNPIFKSHLLNLSAVGATRNAITKSMIEDLDLLIPSLETQYRISSILSSLDKKIENNLNTNQSLKEISGTLFKEWFANFNYPNADGKRKHSELGEIPESWRVNGIGEICYVQNGYAFKSKDFQEQGEVGIIKIKNINRNVVDIQNTDFVDATVVAFLDKKFKIESGALLIAMTGAEVGKIGLVPLNNKNLWLNQRVGMIKEKVPFGNLWMYLLLSSDTYQATIQNSALGSAQPNISASVIESIRAIIPPADLIETFGRIVKPMFEKILDNLAENETLKNTRDSLLPKLMSGEIEVNG
jgi:type I restriction enzyme S subunit